MAEFLMIYGVFGFAIGYAVACVVTPWASRRGSPHNHMTAARYPTRDPKPSDKAMFMAQRETQGMDRKQAEKEWEEKI